MARRIEDDREWLEKHLGPLMEAGQTIASLDQTLPSFTPTYDKGYWTGLKLISLKYYIKPYLEILTKRTPVAYVDLFAGPGLNQIGDRCVPLPGSPLIPIMLQQTAEAFGAYFFVEKKREYFQALERRVKRAMPQEAEYELHCMDANMAISRLGDFLSENKIGHSLVFIDPEGLEFAWASMEALVNSIRCDLIVNFPSAGLQRIGTMPAGRPIIARFLGVQEEELPRTIDEEWAIQKYREGLATLGKDVSTEIRITDYGSFHYHLVPAVRKTYTGSPWFRTFRELRDRIERLHGGVLDLVAQQIEGTLGVLC